MSEIMHKRRQLLLSTAACVRGLAAKRQGCLCRNQNTSQVRVRGARAR
jgi:hypothetical protein